MLTSGHPLAQNFAKRLQTSSFFCCSRISASLSSVAGRSAITPKAYAAAASVSSSAAGSVIENTVIGFDSFQALCVIDCSDWIDCLRSFNNRTIDGLAYRLRMIVNTQRNVRFFVINSRRSSERRCSPIFPLS